MHAIPHAVDEATPCNAYCTGDVHVDITYDAKRPARGFPSMTAHLHHVLTRTGILEVLAIAPAPEAPPVQVRYPDADTAYLIERVGLPHAAWQAFRVTYRILERSKP